MPAAEQTATELQKWMARVTITVSMLSTRSKQEDREVLTLIAGLSPSLSPSPSSKHTFITENFLKEVMSKPFTHRAAAKTESQEAVSKGN